MNSTASMKMGALKSLARLALATAGRIVRGVAIAFLVIGSLLAFPAGVPGLIAVWLGCATGLALSGRTSWPALAGCLIVVVVKRFDWPPGLYCLAASFALGVACDLRWRGETDRRALRRRRIVLLSFLWLAWGGFAWDWRRSYHASHAIASLDGRPIVCIGDSLTSYPPRGGYPASLKSLVRVPIVNLGEPGITSAEALKQLPKLKAARPQAVIIEVGGHDFLKDPSWSKTDGRRNAKRNLEQLILAARSQGAEAVIIEVPRGFVVDPFAGLERELAREYDLELIPDTAIRNFVLWSRSCPPGAWTEGPYLSDDGLHPTSRGEEYLAEVVLASLVRLFGPTIKSGP
jgi:acyl-CoA thioesterase-1